MQCTATVQCYLEKYFVHQQDSSFPDVRLGGHKLVENKDGRIYNYTRGTYHKHREFKLEIEIQETNINGLERKTAKHQQHKADGHYKTEQPMQKIAKGINHSSTRSLLLIQLNYIKTHLKLKFLVTLWLTAPLNNTQTLKFKSQLRDCVFHWLQS